MHSRKASSLWVELTTMTLFETTRKKLKKIFSVQESSIYCMQNDVGLPLNSQTTVKLAGESRFRHRRITSSHSKCKDKSGDFTSRSRKSRRSQCKIRGSWRTHLRYAASKQEQPTSSSLSTTMQQLVHKDMKKTSCCFPIENTRTNKEVRQSNS